MRINRFIQKNPHAYRPDISKDISAMRQIESMRRTGSQLEIAGMEVQGQKAYGAAQAIGGFLSQAFQGFVKAEQTSQYITTQGEMSKALQNVELEMRQLDVDRLREQYPDLEGQPIPAYYQKYYEDKRSEIYSTYEQKINRSLARGQLTDWWNAEQSAADARAGAIGLQRGMEYLKAELELNIKTGIENDNLTFVKKALDNAVITGVLSSPEAAVFAAEAEHDIAYWKVLNYMKLNTPDLEMTRDFINGKQFQDVLSSSGLDPDILGEDDKSNLLSVMTREINLNDAIAEKKRQELAMNQSNAIVEGLYRLKMATEWNAADFEKLEQNILGASAIDPGLRRSYLDELTRIISGDAGDDPPVPAELLDQFSSRLADMEETSYELIQWVNDNFDSIGSTWAAKFISQAKAKVEHPQYGMTIKMVTDHFNTIKKEYGKNLTPEMAAAIDTQAGSVVTQTWEILSRDDLTPEQKQQEVMKILIPVTLEDPITEAEIGIEAGVSRRSLPSKQFRQALWENRIRRDDPEQAANITQLKEVDTSIMVEYFGSEPESIATDPVYGYPIFRYVTEDGVHDFAVKPGEDGVPEIVIWDPNLEKFVPFDADLKGVVRKQREIERAERGEAAREGLEAGRVILERYNLQGIPGIGGSGNTSGYFY